MTVLVVGQGRPVGDVVMDRARADGIDVSPVVRRAGVQTGLVVNVVDALCRRTAATALGRGAGRHPQVDRSGDARGRA